MREPDDLVQARKYLAEYEKDGRKGSLRLGLSYIYNLLEGEHDDKYKERAKNLINSHRIKLSDEINDLFSDYASITLQKINRLINKLNIFMDEYDFDENGTLDSSRNKLNKIRVGLEAGLSPKETEDLFNQLLLK